MGLYFLSHRSYCFSPCGIFFHTDFTDYTDFSSATETGYSLHCLIFSGAHELVSYHHYYFHRSIWQSWCYDTIHSSGTRVSALNFTPTLTTLHPSDW